jgi:hypothetical protein
VFVLFDKFDVPAAITANVKHREPDDREFTSATTEADAAKTDA